MGLPSSALVLSTIFPRWFLASLFFPLLTNILCVLDPIVEALLGPVCSMKGDRGVTVTKIKTSLHIQRMRGETWQRQDTQSYHLARSRLSESGCKSLSLANRSRGQKHTALVKPNHVTFIYSQSVFNVLVRYHVNDPFSLRLAKWQTLTLWFGRKQRCRIPSATRIKTPGHSRAPTAVDHSNPFSS